MRCSSAGKLPDAQSAAMVSQCNMLFLHVENIGVHRQVSSESDSRAETEESGVDSEDPAGLNRLFTGGAVCRSGSYGTILRRYVLTLL